LKGHVPATMGRRSTAQPVPGDFVHLSAGDMVPADVVLLSAKGQRSLGPLDVPNVGFMGTNVASGTAKAVVVVATGPGTYLGDLSKQIVGGRAPTGAMKSCT